MPLRFARPENFFVRQFVNLIYDEGAVSQLAAFFTGRRMLNVAP
jgi:hypothetical protein